jgi:hypothetical protein
LALWLHACTYYPTRQPPDTPPVNCGNDVIDSPELCDGPDLSEQSCRDMAVPGREGQTFYRGELRCARNCLGYDTSRCSGFCGDARIDQDAPLEPESCDSTNLGGLRCQDFLSPGEGPFYGGNLRCAETCRSFDVSGCKGYCGDGIRQWREGERCDGTDVQGLRCRDYGFYRGDLRCEDGCQVIDPSGCNGICGDNVTDVDQGEECDGLGVVHTTCRDFGYYHGQPTCLGDCHVNSSPCFGFCGDGVLEQNEGERCDRSAGLTKTCRDLGFYRGQISCSSACDFDTSRCAGFCGDGVCEDAEGENCASCASDCTCGIFGDCNPAGYCECIIPNTMVNCSLGCDSADRMYANCLTCGGPGCEEVSTVPFGVAWRQFMPNYPTLYSKCGPSGSCLGLTGTLFFPDGCEPWFETYHTTSSGSQCVSDMDACTQAFIDDLEQRGLWPKGRARFGGDAIHLIQLQNLACEE